MKEYAVIFSELAGNIKKHKKVLTKQTSYGTIKPVNAKMELCVRGNLFREPTVAASRWGSLVAISLRSRAFERKSKELRYAPLPWQKALFRAVREAVVYCNSGGTDDFFVPVARASGAFILRVKEYLIYETDSCNRHHIFPCQRTFF